MTTGPEPGKESEFHAGEWVLIEGFLRPGRIASIDAGRRVAEVEVAGIVWRVKTSRLRRSVGARELGERSMGENRPPAVSIPAMSGTDVIDLHGLRVEDALDQLDKFVDTALVLNFSTIKIIHGHGSGRLRNAARDFLANHPYVLNFRFGAPWEGGLAVTVVRLGGRDA